MNLINPYILIPSNPNLRHCSSTFLHVLNDIKEENNAVIQPLVSSTNSLFNLFNLLVELYKSNSNVAILIFLFAIDPIYIPLLVYCKILNLCINKKIRIYYMMHEPKYERGRINPCKAFLVFLYNLYFSSNADFIIIASKDALARAKKFVSQKKILMISLTHPSNSRNKLISNLSVLSFTWDRLKQFSLIGRASLDKNPMGFINLAELASAKFLGSSNFIRAGKDYFPISYPKSIIHFPGYIQSSSKDFLYSLTHIIVIPYKYSTQSGVIPEALSYGKILIVNDIPAFSYLRGLNFVFTVDFDCKHSLVSCLEEIFSLGQEDYQSRCLAAIEYFEENHSEAYLKRELERVLLDAV